MHVTDVKSLWQVMASLWGLCCVLAYVDFLEGLPSPEQLHLKSSWLDLLIGDQSQAEIVL